MDKNQSRPPRLALCVNRVGENQNRNFDAIVSLCKQSIDGGADHIFLPETCITGLVNGRDPSADLKLGIDATSQEFRVLQALSGEHGVWIGVGSFEQADGRLYDSYFVFGPDGKLALTQRRLGPGWLLPDADPDFYGCGDRFETLQTPLGKLLVIICGDLFDDDLVAKAQSQNADWVIYPFARAFPSARCDQKEWDERELPEYLRRLQRIGPRAAMVNYLSEPKLGGYFGGAWIMQRGTIVKDVRLGEAESILFVDANSTTNR